MRVSVILMLALLLLSACGGEWQSYPQNDPLIMATSQSNIPVVDQLDIQVFGEADLSGHYDVDTNGAISMPLIGSIAVNGLKDDEIATVIAQRLVEGGFMVAPEVIVKSSTARHFYVMGEVMSSGEYPLKDGMTVLDAIAKAGGFTYRAEQSHFDIVRKQTGGSEAQIEANIATKLYPQDIVRVRERFF